MHGQCFHIHFSLITMCLLRDIFSRLPYFWSRQVNSLRYADNHVTVSPVWNNRRYLKRHVIRSYVLDELIGTRNVNGRYKCLFSFENMLAIWQGNDCSLTPYTQDHNAPVRLHFMSMCTLAKIMIVFPKIQ